MGKTVTKIEDIVLSVAKAAPLIAGGLTGFVASGIGQSPINALKKGEYEYAIDELIANYAFWDVTAHGFDISKGAGIKGLILGELGSKFVKFVAEW